LKEKITQADMKIFLHFKTKVSHVVLFLCLKADFGAQKDRMDLHYNARLNAGSVKV